MMDGVMSCPPVAGKGQRRRKGKRNKVDTCNGPRKTNLKSFFSKAVNSTMKSVISFPKEQREIQGPVN